VWVLGFDTSSPAVTAAVSTGLSPRAEHTEVAQNRHGELLAPLITDVLDEAGVAVGNLAAIGVGLGPGPFTGLRVGIVTAKAMGDALGIPVYGVSSLDVIAQQHDFVAYDHDNDVEHEFAVLTDARRKQVYWAHYDCHGMQVLDGPHLDQPADVAQQLHGRVTHLVGAGAVLYREVFADFVVVERGPYPSAATLAEMVYGRALRGEPSEALVPLYLRRPDARPPGAPKKVTPA
jgi:tRNA threonylcarbamoyl adenosine modification protein YeaZ